MTNDEIGGLKIAVFVVTSFLNDHVGFLFSGGEDKQHGAVLG